MRSEAHIDRTQGRPRGCGGPFTDCATLIQHLEADTCPSGITHAAIDKVLPSCHYEHLLTTEDLLDSSDMPSTLHVTSSAHIPRSEVFICDLCNGAFPTASMQGAPGPSGRESGRFAQSRAVSDVAETAVNSGSSCIP